MSFFFFDDAEVDRNANKKERSKRAVPMHTAKKLQCKVCPLAKIGNHTFKMAPSGNTTDPLVLFLGEGPGEQEDKEGVQFVGKSGQVLRGFIPKGWVQDIAFDNTVRCRTPANRNPEEVELECCRGFVEKDIEKMQPEVIVAVGAVALKWLIGESNIMSWHGRYVPARVGEHKCWVYPIIHPAFALRKRRLNKRTGQRDIQTEWDHLIKLEIKQVLDDVDNKRLGEPTVVESDHLTGTEWVMGKSDKDMKKVLRWLKELQDEPIVAIDIETNALRPYGKAHFYVGPNDRARMLSVAIGTKDRTVAFPLHYRPGTPDAPWTKAQRETIFAALKEFILNSGIKVAHNLKFEQEWFAYFLGEEILRDTKWSDTQAQAYALHERRGMLSLDVMIRLHFGFWLKDLSKLNRARMEDYALDKILPYNALDTLWTHALWERLEDKLEKDKTLRQVSRNLIRTAPTLVCIQSEGLCVDQKEKDKVQKELDEKIKDVEERIQDLPEVQEYNRQFKKFSPSAPYDVIKCLKHVYQLGPELMGKEGKESTNESVLGALEGVELATLILEYRGLTKKLSTYITPMEEHVFPDGKIHTNYNPYETTTGRLSSESPNVQNFPKRKGKEVRRMIIPPEGWWLVSADYGQIEARIIGVASQDNVFCDALWNNYDVHMEWAERIAKVCPDKVGGKAYLNDKERLKKFRGDIKNQWVFPAFYGASPRSIASAMQMPNELVDALFREFWDTFKGVKKWQKWMMNFYERHGYVETLTGRRRHAPMSLNELINAPIQGTASDICVDAMNRLSEAGIQVVMNVHDDVTSIVPDEELEGTIDFIAKEMCEVPFEWVNVPIAVEVSVGDNWCDQEDIATFVSTDFHSVPRDLREIGHYQKYLS